MWRNGYIPESELVIFARGYNSTDGNWYHGLTPSTKARHDALLRRAYRRKGRWLAISSGWSAYRPMHAQEIARRIWGNGAATPGTSSHGGYWERRETLAMDYGNWSWVYDGNRAQFYEDARAVGLTPGMIEPSRGYPDEPWHIIDLNPKSAVPRFGDEGAPESTPAAPQPLLEDDDMLMLEIDKRHQVALGPGIFRHFIPQDNPDKIKNLSRIQDDWQQISLSELPALLVTYGCDLHIWDVRDGQFVVLNALNGSVGPGNAWTSANATRAEIAGLTFPVPDPTPIVEAVRDAIAKTPIGDRPDIDETAIAVAVRAEFAKNPLTAS